MTQAHGSGNWLSATPRRRQCRPGVDPAFPVLEGGNLFQYAATTAREYGVPAVLNARNAIKRILDGVWMTVDGMAGVVEIECGE